MLTIITWIIWFGYVAVLISTDAGRRRLRNEAASDESQIDLGDKSIWPWIVVALLVGPLVLPIYYWQTRREWGFLVGLGWMFLGLFIVTAVRALLVMPLG